MQANSWHKLFLFSFVLLNQGSVEKKGKITKIEYFENKKGFLDEIKTIFHSFWRAII